MKVIYRIKYLLRFNIKQVFWNTKDSPLTGFTYHVHFCYHMYLLSHLIDFFTDVKDDHNKGYNFTKATQ